MTKIGIMLTLDDEETISIIEPLNLKLIDNIPLHVTLYVLEINPKDKKLIKKEAISISNNFLPVEISFKNVELSNYGTLRLIVDKTPNLQKFHEEIVKNIVKFRDKNAFSKAKEFYSEFSEEEQKLIEKYGRPNVMQNFEPHITLGKTNEKINLEISKKTKINKITIYYDISNGWKKI